MDFRLGREFDFSVAAPLDRGLAAIVGAEGLPEGTLLNVNCPGGRAEGDRGDEARQAALQRRAEAGRGGLRRPQALPDLRLRARASRTRTGTDLSAVAARLRRDHADPLRPDRPRRVRSARELRLEEALERVLESVGERERGGTAPRPRRRGELREEIAKYDHAYYVLDDPLIGDEEYDKLLDELRAIEAEQPGAAHAGLADPAGRRQAGRGLRRSTSTASRCSRWPTPAPPRSSTPGRSGSATCSSATTSPRTRSPT